ncbi:MAG: HD-GYP domain-containing protein, partial [Candidatus Eiseniibacteriota bacterium]
LYTRCAEHVQRQLTPGVSRICGRGHRIVCHSDGLRVVLPKTMTTTGAAGRHSGTRLSGRLGRFLGSLRPFLEGVTGLFDDARSDGAVVARGLPGVLGEASIDPDGDGACNVNPVLAATVRSLVAAIDAKDAYTRGHSERVQIAACAIGAAMGLDAAAATDLYWAALLHDIGKIGVPDAILNKVDSLDADEVATLRQHPVLGAEMLAPLDWLERARQAIRHHHERIDGKGYPDGLSGDEIPLAARIIAVADTFDAMISRRHYRRERCPAEALEELIDVAGRQLDLEVVGVFETSFDSICGALRQASHVAEGLLMDDGEALPTATDGSDEADEPLRRAA